MYDFGFQIIWAGSHSERFVDAYRWSSVLIGAQSPGLAFLSDPMRE